MTCNYATLKKGVDVWQPRDEWYFEGVGWEEISSNWWGKVIDFDEAARRPIKAPECARLQ